MFYLTVHRFLARVQSPTCTIYGKFLLESIMAVLTPKSGIDWFLYDGEHWSLKGKKTVANIHPEAHLKSIIEVFDRVPTTFYKLSVNGFFTKYEQICCFLRICSNLLKKFLDRKLSFLFSASAIYWSFEKWLFCELPKNHRNSAIMKCISANCQQPSYNKISTTV